MAELQTHIAEAIGKHVPKLAEATVKELVFDIMAAVALHRGGSYGPTSGRVPAGELRRPNPPSQRQPGEEQGVEVPPQ